MTSEIPRNPRAARPRRVLNRKTGPGTTMRSFSLRLRFALLLPLASAFFASGNAAAQDARPCAAEAETVAKMKQRDPSLVAPTDPEAAKHIEAAKRAYGVGEYDKAIEEYTAAGLIVDSPLVLYNMAQTYRASKQYEKAIRQYRLFLDRGQPGSEVRVLVECHIRTMTAELEHAAASAPPQGPNLDPGETSSDQATPIEDLEEPVDPGSDGRWTSMRYAAVGSVGVGVLVLGSGLVFGVQSQGYKDDAAAICPSNPCARAQEANALSAKADDRAAMANVGYIAGGVLVATGAVLWFIGGPDGDDSTSSDEAVRFIPMLSREAAGLAFTTRF